LKQVDRETDSQSNHGESHMKNVPKWFPIAGGIFAFATLLFFMALVVASTFNHVVPADSRFLVIVVLSVGSALSFSFLGGSAIAKGNIPILSKYLFEFTVSGGVAVLVIILIVGNSLYVRPVTQFALQKPIPLAPESGSIYFHIPRITKLEWKPLEGAVAYEIQLEYEIGNLWAEWPEWPELQRTNQNFFTFEFRGGQPGRWRVRAINRDGVYSLYSDWWQFRYTR
jgi:hypothetical protein